MRESYVIKSQIYYPDTPIYTEALSGENTDEYYKDINGEIKSLMIRDTWEIVSGKSVADHNMIPGTWSLKFKRRPD